ncbi:hypothetical protein B296_00017824 [Ensete ventricosum]|uniref:Uncharacterized protein n=1 Tax=Ensete ventricosum TaxID=4639 RepID=A0A426YW95_ENSVE|nr:hypothetical protein B296_00017824 [Ensete ventricosum]
MFLLRQVSYKRGKGVILLSPPTFLSPNLPYPFNRSMHLSLPNIANSDLLLPSSLITANSDPYGKKLPAAIFRCKLFTSQLATIVRCQLS